MMIKRECIEVDGRKKTVDPKTARSTLCCWGGGGCFVAQFFCRFPDHSMDVTDDYLAALVYEFLMPLAAKRDETLRDRYQRLAHECRYMKQLVASEVRVMHDRARHAAALDGRDAQQAALCAAVQHVVTAYVALMASRWRLINMRRNELAMHKQAYPMRCYEPEEAHLDAMIASTRRSYDQLMTAWQQGRLPMVPVDIPGSPVVDN